MSENNYPPGMDSKELEGNFPDAKIELIDTVCKVCKRYYLAEAWTFKNTYEVIEIRDHCRVCGGDLSEVK